MSDREQRCQYVTRATATEETSGGSWRWKSSPLCRRLLRRLVSEHGVKFDRPIEDYFISRDDEAIRRNTTEGMAYATWHIYANGSRECPSLSLERPKCLHQRWEKCGYVWTTIESAYTVTQLVRAPFKVEAEHAHLTLY